MRAIVAFLLVVTSAVAQQPQASTAAPLLLVDSFSITPTTLKPLPGTEAAIKVLASRPIPPWTDDERLAAVRILAAQGHVCRVFGHNWHGGRVGECGGVTFCDYHPNTTYRHCDVCGLGQAQSLEWK